MGYELLMQFTNISLSNPIGVSFGVGLVRSLAGWFEGMAVDWRKGKIVRKPDFGKFVETLFRVMPQALGLGAVAPGAEVGALLSDFALMKAKKPVKK